MANSLATPSLPAIKKTDLDDPTEIQLNSNFTQVWNKVIWLAGGAGIINIPNTIVAKSFQNPSQTGVPTNNAELLTLGSALTLFQPSNTRTALQTGAFATSPTAVSPSQPLPQTIVSSTAPTSSTSPGAPGQIAYDATNLYICVASNTWRRVVTSSF